MNYLSSDSLIIFIILTSLHYLLVVAVARAYITVPPGYSLFKHKNICCFSLDDNHKKLIDFNVPVWHKDKFLSIKAPAVDFDQEIDYRNFYADTCLSYQDFYVTIKLPILLEFQIEIALSQIIKILKSDFKGGSIEDYMAHYFHGLQNQKAITEIMKKIKDKLLDNESNYFNADLVEFDQSFLDGLKHFIKLPESNETFSYITMHLQEPVTEIVVNPEIIEGKV